MPENIRSEALWGVTEKLKADYVWDDEHGWKKSDD